MGSPSGVGSLDAVSLTRDYQQARSNSRAVLEEVLRRMAASPVGVWIFRLEREEILAQVERLEKRRAVGEQPALYGLPFAVKDNIDVAGLPTTAGCPAYRYLAKQSSPVVARLQDAGA